MDWVKWAVVASAGVTTVWLVYYTHYYLPRMLDERFRDSITAFSTAVELRFPTHVGLTKRVQALAFAVGQHLKLLPRQMRDLEMAARLRDVGLCAIPYGLVNGRTVPDWNDAEQQTYDQHAKVSGAMLEMVPTLRHLAPIVRNHHAPYNDGTTDSATGQNLPIESLILKVVSEYVWMERWQGPLLTRQTINDGRGTIFAPEVVDALWNVLPSSRVADSRQNVHSA